MANNPKYTVPGLTLEQGGELIGLLQGQLHVYNELHLTLKHAHWNVVGPNFISVHEMIDPEVDTVRGYADEVAERIATLGGSPTGTPGALVAGRAGVDYAVGRDTTTAHLAALDVVYQGVIGNVRVILARVAELDPITEDLLIGQAAGLEHFHWFIRAHLGTVG